MIGVRVDAMMLHHAGQGDTVFAEIFLLDRIGFVAWQAKMTLNEATDALFDLAHRRRLHAIERVIEIEDPRAHMPEIGCDAFLRLQMCACCRHGPNITEAARMRKLRWRSIRLEARCSPMSTSPLWGGRSVEASEAKLKCFGWGQAQCGPPTRNRFAISTSPLGGGESKR